jgi:uncharacterized protein (TIGR00730 family)
MSAFPIVAAVDSGPSTRSPASPRGGAAPRSVCLFCSASDSVRPSARLAARELGMALAAAKIALVFGGGTKGLMGEAAAACQDAGGEVTGIIPRDLVSSERLATDIGVLHVVDTLSQRKQMMADLAGCFVSLPGGVGTLDETIEMITWYDLRIHQRPVFLCNVDGFWDPFEAMMARWADYGVLRPHLRGAWRTLPDVQATVRAIRDYLDGVGAWPAGAAEECRRT